MSLHLGEQYPDLRYTGKLLQVNSYKSINSYILMFSY